MVRSQAPIGAALNAPDHAADSVWAPHRRTRRVADHGGRTAEDFLATEDHAVVGGSGAQRIKQAPPEKPPNFSAMTDAEFSAPRKS